MASLNNLSDKGKENTKKLNFAIVGCGRIAHLHAKIISSLPNANLAYVFDVNKKRAKLFSSEFKCKYVSDYKSLLSKKDIDVVVITAPSGLHVDLAVKALNAKKHVISEKPLALTVKGAEKVYEASKKNKRSVFVIKQYRFNPPVIKLKEALNAGRFKKPFLFNITMWWTRPQRYFDEAKWRGTRKMDGGVLFNQANHHVDLLLWLGGKVKSVFAKMDNFTHKTEAEDTIVVIAKFKNNALGVIEATISTYPKNIEGSVTVLGSHGSVKLGGNSANKIDIWDFYDYSNEDDSIKSTCFVPSNVFAYSHIENYKNIIGSLMKSKKPFVDINDEINAIKFITAVYKSAKLKKEVFLE